MRRFCRIIFSRYAVSALFILAEIAMLAYFLIYFSIYSLAFFIVAIIVDVLVLISLINREINPEFKLSWAVTVTVMPLLGAALYLIFYSRRISRKDADFMTEMSVSIKEAERAAGYDSMSCENLRELSEVSRTAAGHALSILGSDRLSGIYTGTVSSYYSTGEEYYEQLLAHLSEAKRYIFIETFIISEGEMWDSLLSILRKKVKEGVEVRILYDDVGSMSTVPADFALRLRAEGINCHRFGKVSPRLVSTHNNRDHRKIIVIDGEVAFTGGINIADEYINRRVRFGHWKDGGVKLVGRAAWGFAKLFLCLYDVTVKRQSNYSKYMPSLSDAQNKKTGFVIPFGSGPYPIYKTEVGKGVLMNVINSADRYIYLTTPYLILDYDLTEALRSASRRGVDVRIITPGIPDKRVIKLMTKSAYPRLIEAGVRIFEYTKGFIHEKCVVSDGVCSVISTINLDYRSLVHHFEDGAWIYGDPVVSDIEQSFMKTLECSSEIGTEDARLTLKERIVKCLIRIFAPLM